MEEELIGTKEDAIAVAGLLQDAENDVGPARRRNKYPQARWRCACPFKRPLPFFSATRPSPR